MPGVFLDRNKLPLCFQIVAVSVVCCESVGGVDGDSGVDDDDDG